MEWATKADWRMKGRNYREPKGQPYARKEYIRGPPMSKIVKFVMGDTRGTYTYKVSLVALNGVQIRHNALEAARISANKNLTEKVGDKQFLLKIRVYPHIILRENKMIATAGADRLQEGMRRSFGKPIGRAARVKANEAVIEVYVDDEGVEAAKSALKICASKIPTPCRVVIERLKEEKEVPVQ